MDKVSRFAEENGVVFDDVPEELLEEDPISEMIFEWNGGEYHAEEQNA